MDAGSAPERICEAHLRGSAAGFPALHSACRHADATPAPEGRKWILSRMMPKLARGQC